MHKSGIVKLLWMFCALISIQVVSVGAQQDLCETAEVDINLLNVVLLDSCVNREADGFGVDSYCIASERVSVWANGEIGFPFVRDIISPISAGQRVINEAFGSGFGWGVVAYKFRGDNIADTSATISAIAFGDTEVQRLPDAEDGLVRLSVRALTSDIDDPALRNTFPDTCNHDPSGFIFGVDNQGIDITENPDSGAIYINDVHVEMQSRAQLLFERNEIRIVHIEGRIDITFADEPTITLTENARPEYAGLLFDESGAIERVYEGRLFPSDIDRLSFDPQLLYAAINFRSPDFNQISGQIVGTETYGTFQGIEPGLPNVLSFAIAASSAFPQSQAESGVSGATNTGTQAVATVLSTSERGTRDFVDRIFFNASPEDGMVTVSVACPDDGNTELLDCIDGGLENPTIAIFNQNGILIAPENEVRSSGRVDYTFTPVLEGVYTILVSGTGKPPRVFGYCISTTMSAGQCSDALPQSLQESPRIFFPPEFEPLPPQEITAGEEFTIPITVFDPNGELSFSQPVPAVEDDSLIEIVNFSGANNNYNLTILGLTESEAPTSVLVTATTTTLDGETLTSQLAIPFNITGCEIPPNWIPYVIQPGDTPFNVSQRIPNFTLDDLYAGNCLSPGDPFRAGDTIWLPRNPGGTPVDGIIVNTSGTGIANDGFCSLIEAIIAANNDLPSGTQPGECTPASTTGFAGLPDRIVLQAPGPYVLSSSFASEVGLPPVTSTMTIEGNGNTIQRISSIQFRIFRIDAGGNLTLNNAVVSGGDVRFGGANGGGIQNSGTLTLNGTVSGNFAVDGGGISNLGGFVTINGSVTGNVANINGGGILNRGTLIVNGSVSANSANGNGGGVSNSTLHTMQLNGATFNNNTNGAIANGGILTISGASFNGNNPGGAAASVVINAQGSSTTFNNTSIGGNTGINCAGPGTIIVGSGNTGGDGSCF